MSDVSVREHTTVLATLSAADRAHVLVEALGWMRVFRDQIVVVKYGGHAMTDPAAQSAFLSDILFLRQVGLRPVIVHGGGPQVSAMLARLGIETPFRDGVRVTTPEAMEVVRMVLTGQVQRTLIRELNSRDSLAVGMSGEDGALFLARRRRPLGEDGKPVDIGLVGDIEEVNPEAVLELLDAGRVPVVSSVALDLEDRDGVLNVNADTAACELAVALGASKLLMLTDVEGVYRDYPDPASLIRSIRASELRELLPTMASGMIPKVEACLRAIDGGVGQVHVIDGRLAHSVLIEVMTDAGTGTMVLPD